MLKLIIFLALMHNTLCSFSNVVVYPNKSDDGIYRFYFVVEEGLTMSYWNTSRGTEQIVVKLNDTYFLRDRRTITSCGNVFPMDEKLLDSIVIGAGKHKEVLLVNKTLSGPPIVVPLNSMVQITVTNRMKTDALSMHWHGIIQFNTFYMDGVSRITQCPIGPGDTYVYEFKATDIGTHWYHAHSGEQRMDGVYGPFIVTNSHANDEIATLEIPESMRYDKEFYFLVQELFETSGDNIVEHIIWEIGKFQYGLDEMNSCSPNTFTDDGTPAILLPFIREKDAVIVNGRGSYKIMTQVNKIYDVDSILSSKAFEMNLEVFTVEPNKRYLFRGVGSNGGQPLEIRIGGHKLYIVALDGTSIKPVQVDSLIINAGERIDFYIETKNSSDQLNYFIVMKTLETKNERMEEIEKDNFGLAILKYTNVNTTNVTCADACQPCNRANKCIKFNCPFWPNKNDGAYRCVTLDQMRSKNIPESDADLLMTNYTSDQFEEYFFNFQFSGATSLRSSINGKRFIMPSIPLFFKTNTDSIMNRCPTNCSLPDQTCECTHKVEIGTNKTIQFVIYNMGSGAGIEGNPHPVHLHGHHFYIVKTVYPSYNPVNYTYARQSQDLTCASELDVCTKNKWRNSSWSMGNVPGMNLVDPPLKDTFFVPVGGYVVIRFRSNNPGYWLMHCHIDVHHAEGMVVLIQEGTSDQIASSVDFSKINFCSRGLDRVSSFV